MLFAYSKGVADNLTSKQTADLARHVKKEFGE
jgi:hypothetical protein